MEGRKWASSSLVPLQRCGSVLASGVGGQLGGLWGEGAQAQEPGTDQDVSP